MQIEAKAEKNAFADKHPSIHLRHLVFTLASELGMS